MNESSKVQCRECGCVIHVGQWGWIARLCVNCDPAGNIVDPLGIMAASRFPKPVDEARVVCPDGGFCHHDCSTDPEYGVCWRSKFCAPLSEYGDEWPDDCTPRIQEPQPL